MRIKFPVYDLMIFKGLELLSSDRYNHLYCYSVFSSSGQHFYFLSDSKLSALDFYRDYTEFLLIGEMYSERGEK